jgi:hypothetical protein
MRNFHLSPNAQNSVEQYRSTFVRFDDVWEGLIWLLTRNPEPIGICYEFETRNGTTYLHAGTHGDFVAGIPDVWAVYSYDERELTIHDVYACETTPDDDG